MIVELLKHPDYVRVLKAVERKALRFSELEKALDLNPTQVMRALAFLRKGLWIVPATVPTEKGPIRVQYRLGKRGAAFLKSFESFCAQIERHKADLGRAEVAELLAFAK